MSHAETDAIIAELEHSGLVAIGHDAEGRETWTLTPAGAQVARQMAMGDEATFNAILDAVEAGATRREEARPRAGPRS
jgi:hypothetical protein